ncbi:alpha/beta hydrolase [Microlunatus elymi]|uniref:Alpha/beta hydrolase n=1 Tax=Microlunatus elymi TaxID=2596828 RepID=A0A516Q3X7_9ACTN|nr:alpha/beta fold hydrolase [Microlunatus elymi]QDP98137.1 alpha/beta hydrolase [Microlunatus elymi]
MPIVQRAPNRPPARVRRLLPVALASVALILPAAVLPLATGPTLATAATAKPGRTKAVEARRVDRVPTPKLHWYGCDDYPGARCATVKLPRDYDKPHGAKVQLAVVKTPATDQKHKIGSLFVNPGGPGGSATELAAYAPYLFSASVLRRFDVIGIDPRGTNYSARVKCFPDARRQQPTMAKLAVAFPYTKAEVRSFGAGSTELGRACSGHGRPLTGAVSTAEDARDMDVIRRAVGDSKVTYLGFSYGTYLGQVYAGLFPDRVRSMVIDGVVDPVAWAGTSKTRATPQTVRLRSGQGGHKALTKLLSRCDAAGRKRCSFASADSGKKFDRLVRRLQKHPLKVHDPFFGDFTFDYPALISDTLSGLYDPEGYEYIIDELTELWALTAPAKIGTAAGASALGRLGFAHQRLAARQQNPLGFSYDNSSDAYWSVMCTDALNPRHGAAWQNAATRTPSSAKYFGELWAWSSRPCARTGWTVHDEDAYRGPFTRRTAGPVLVVGNYWDPATYYLNAKKVARMLPHSRLLLSDNWGHTAYGTSACVTKAVNRALISVKLPAKGARCLGNAQPFSGSSRPMMQRMQKSVAGADVMDIVRGVPGRL